MAYQAQGFIHKIFDTEQKSEKFQTREFVIEQRDSQYPQMIKFQLTQDKCSLVDTYNEGDEITVHFDLRGREWNEKYFTNLQCWKIEAGAGSTQSGNQSSAGSSKKTEPAASITTGSRPEKNTNLGDEDIPF